MLPVPDTLNLTKSWHVLLKPNMATVYRERETVVATVVTRNEGHTPPLGRSYAPRHRTTVGTQSGVCPEFRVTPVPDGRHICTAAETSSEQEVNPLKSHTLNPKSETSGLQWLQCQANGSNVCRVLKTPAPPQASNCSATPRSGSPSLKMTSQAEP